MRKKSYAVQAPENVYKILSEFAETRNIPKVKAIEIMVQFFADNNKAVNEVALPSSNSEKQFCSASPLRLFKDAN